ncbi:hypothetical protein [Roseicella frigidaeris]|uniref:Uncharacterized protein n=1 Tax=Roseicella frigidaeris TaxID=2230885 RepID=A0A327MF72_9PROT|nr:hypothetical protein [Roseicella frigidaeris]RAI60724.1 hypothetical protein DOO78_00900 [Roseicella frigidaeris]
MGHVTSFAPRVLRGYPTVVAALEEPEALVLRSLRCWVVELRRAAEPLPRLHRMLSAVGAPDAAASIDMLMHVVARTALRPVGIGCPCCPDLAPDEQRLLHAARLAQGWEARLAEEVLRDDLLTPEGASFAQGPLVGLGRVLGRAGLRLRPRSLTGLAEAIHAGASPWMPPSTATIH